MSSDTSQERHPRRKVCHQRLPPAHLPMPSDPDAYLSIIHSLETKLITRRSLKGVTARLESQQARARRPCLPWHQQWANTEALGS